MKSFKGLLNKSKNLTTISSKPTAAVDASTDPHVADALRSVTSFCESASSAGSEEVTHLPVIVDAAESSPAAASAIAQQLRKYFGKEWLEKPAVQYNAIMVIRILSSNPGPSFTRNFDKNFVSDVKGVLKGSKDRGTQSALRESLDTFEVELSYDEGLDGLLKMWRKFKGLNALIVETGTNHVSHRPIARGLPLQTPTGMPPPAELAGRIEEARNTAKILIQLTQSTPVNEVLKNDLLREFGERCRSAQRDMQNFIDSTNPAPDHQTLQTLIETNEQLSLAATRHQRAVLAARKSTEPQAPAPAANGVSNSSTTATPAQAPRIIASQTTKTLNGFPTESETEPTAKRTLLDETPSIQVSNPFLDPTEPDRATASLAIEPMNYGSARTATSTAAPKLPDPTASTSAPFFQANPDELQSLLHPDTSVTARPAAHTQTTQELENAYAVPLPSTFSPANPQLSNGSAYTHNGGTWANEDADEDEDDVYSTSRPTSPAAANGSASGAQYFTAAPTPDSPTKVQVQAQRTQVAL